MSRPQDDIAPKRTPWFWWGLANLLALCFAVASWTLTLEIFGRPDVPRNYEILRNLDRAPEFKSYSPSGAPDGPVHSPPQIYGWFFGMGDQRYAQLNSLYRRNYMRNFDDAHAVSYVEGNFEVLETRPFGEDDFLPDGFAIRARAMVRPDDFSAEAPYPVVIELLVPTQNAEARKQFVKGSRFTLAKAPHLPVVMHVGRYNEEDEPTVQVTVLPIGYGRLPTPAGNTLEMQVPEWVRPMGALRMFDSAEVNP